MRSLVLAALMLASPVAVAQSSLCPTRTAPVYSTGDQYSPFPPGSQIGTVEVTGDPIAGEQGLAVRVIPSGVLDTSQGWVVSNILTYASDVSTPPIDAPSNSLLPGFFPFQTGGNLDVTDYTQVIPQANFMSFPPYVCTTPVNMSVYVGFHKLNDYFTGITGFTYGEHEVTPIDSAGGANWRGWWFVYQNAPTVTGCTKPAGYYKTHSAFSKPAQRDPWPLSENTLICGVTWYSVLNNKSADNWYKLATQWIGAMLNVGDGASTPDEVDDALSQGQTLLNNTCKTMPKAQKNVSSNLTTLLEAYNNGQLQPQACTAPAP